MSTAQNAKEITFDTTALSSSHGLDFSLTQKAVEKLMDLQNQAQNAQLRIRVRAGGCSGFQYEFLLEEQPFDTEKDLVIEQAGAAVRIDKISAVYLQKAQLDYSFELSGERFQITNPNAEASCGCGVSFAFK